MAEKKLTVNVIAPDQILFSGEADSVNVPGALSPFQILYNHAPIISALEQGVIKINDKLKGNLRFLSSTGFVEVLNNKISIMVEKAVNIDEVKLDTITKNIETINKKLQNTELDEPMKNMLLKELEFEEYIKKNILTK